MTQTRLGRRWSKSLWGKSTLLMVVLVLTVAFDGKSFVRSISEDARRSVDEIDKTLLIRKPTKLANRTKVA